MTYTNKANKHYHNSGFGSRESAKKNSAPTPCMFVPTSVYEEEHQPAAHYFGAPLDSSHIVAHNFYGDGDVYRGHHFRDDAGTQHDDAAAAPPQSAAPGGSGGMGLKAASHVSMGDTPQAHEYQPSCTCADCASLFTAFTRYEILDAYLAQHLPYEQRLKDQYGFVPCVGGPHGNVAATYDCQTGQVVSQTQSTTLFFHYHVHEMKPVPADVRNRSCSRFYNVHHGGGAGAVAASSPTIAPRREAFAAQHSSPQHPQHHGGQGRAQRPPNTRPPHHHPSGGSGAFHHGPQSQQHLFYHHHQHAQAMQDPPHDHPCFYPRAAHPAGNDPYYFTSQDAQEVQDAMAFTNAAHLGR